MCCHGKSLQSLSRTRLLRRCVTAFRCASVCSQCCCQLRSSYDMVLQGLIGEESARKISIGTFHAFCSRVLRDFHSEWKMLRNSTMTKNFAIADSSACYRYIKNIIKQKGYRDQPDIKD